MFSLRPCLLTTAKFCYLGNGYNFEDADLEKLFTRPLVGDEQELSLRQIGRIVDKLAMQNAPNPPKSGKTLRVVK